MFKNGKKRILGFNDVPLVIVQILLYSFLSMSIMFPDLLLSGRLKLYLLQWLEALMYMVIYLVIGRYFYILLVKKLPGYGNRQKRIPFLFLILPVYFVVTVVLQLTLQGWINIEIEGYEEDRVLKEVIMGTFFALFGVALYESLYLFVQLKEDQIKLKSLEKEKIQNQLDILKHQLSPHFLFNTFNTLIFIIDKDKEKGKDFVLNLSNVYKKILEFSGRDKITLDEELEYLSSYLKLLDKRFGTNLTFDIDIGENLAKKKIIPLALQIAIENAVKHNVISKKKPLAIKIETSKTHIIVSNKMNPKISNEFSHGIGLNNINDRSYLVSEKRIMVERKNSEFVIKIPLLD